jgi:multiple sugar transport system substrate-binding protein
MSDHSSPSPDPADSVNRSLSRRKLLYSGAAGAAALYGAGAARALGATGAPDFMEHGAAGSVTLGSYEQQAGIKALAADTAAFSHKTGIAVKTNTVDHNTFQEQINSYLQGHPDDVFTWFAGYRMQFFAAKHLATPIDDVWKTLTPQMPPAFKAASTGLDGHQYFVPNKNYPWAVYYRKSLWKEKGYTAPKTWAQFIALAKKMQADGLTPIAFTDKDGWPAMGTFDILNMRINGYQYHVDLMAGKQSWNSAKVKAVFQTWAQLLPYYSQGALGLTWQDGATQLENKQAGMFLLGGFVVSNFKPENVADVDFFPFPAINPKWGQDSIDAPIDGYMISKSPKNLAGAKALVGYLGTAQAINLYLPLNPGNLAANKNADKSHYTALQKKEAALIAKTKHIAQYMDRDTRPDFASTVMIPSLQAFLNNPADINGLVQSIQKQKVAIFGS